MTISENITNNEKTSATAEWREKSSECKVQVARRQFLWV